MIMLQVLAYNYRMHIITLILTYVKLPAATLGILTRIAANVSTTAVVTYGMRECEK